MKTFFSIFLLFSIATYVHGIQFKAEQDPICKLPMDRGFGEGGKVLYYYDQYVNRCVEFVYHGFGGNDNRFDTNIECEQVCKYVEVPTNTTTTTTTSTTTPTPVESTTTAEQTTTADLSPESICKLPLPPARNWPPNSTTAYAYDYTVHKCYYVYYDEGTKNANNFPTRAACVAFCDKPQPTASEPTPVEVICTLPAPPTQDWPTNSSIGYWYDEKTDRCEPVYYDEATKNENNFPSVAECLKTCSASSRGTTASPETTPKPQEPETAPPVTDIQTEPPTLPPTTSSNDPHIICNLPGPPARNWKDHERTGYHFNAATKECDFVYYDQASRSQNMFDTEDECYDFCLPTTSPSTFPEESSTVPSTTTTQSTTTQSTTTPTTTTKTTKATTTTPRQKYTYEEILKITKCSIQHNPGYCNAFIPSYYFNIAQMQCIKYIYGGCQHTVNHYRTISDCENSCVYKPTTHSTTTSAPQTTTQSDYDKKCKVQFTGRCKRSFQGFAYNEKTGRCHHQIRGGCYRPQSLYKKQRDCNHECVHHGFVTPK